MKDHQALLAALRGADWDDLLPRLATYAAACLRRVGWLEGRHVEPSAMSVQDAVNEAIDHCFGGVRNWDPSLDLETFLRGVIRSIVSAEKKANVRSRVDAAGDHIERLADEDVHGYEDEDGEGGRSVILAAAAACAEGDPDLEELYLTITSDDGPTKREDIAKALGWPVDRVSAARIKLKRRLISELPELCEGLKKRRPR